VTGYSHARSNLKAVVKSKNFKLSPQSIRNRVSPAKSSSRQESYELLASPSTQYIHGAQAAASNIAESPQNPIARSMAEGIVH
jgi:hypothetical protein